MIYEEQEYKILIVEAGISVLVAAKVLEDYGYSHAIIEATERVGGRVKTDLIDGYQLDQGFQVLLTGYPAAQKYLDFEALDLQKFLPVATVFKDGSQKIIGDPLRESSFLFSTLFSGIGNLSDKIKILQLSKSLKNKTIAAIFLEKEKTMFAQTTFRFLLLLNPVFIFLKATSIGFLNPDLMACLHRHQ